MAVHAPETLHPLFEHDPGPMNRVRALATRYDFDPQFIMSIENINPGFYHVMSKRQLKQFAAQIRTMYKRKDRKIRPINISLPDGIHPEGIVNLEDPKVQVPRGSRLTPERLASMNIGTGFLSEPEKQLFIDILFKYESAIAFDDSEMGLLRPEIEPPVVIHTIPHVPWQQQNIRLPYAMKEAAIKIVKEKLVYGLLEFSQGPYRSRFFLVKKKDGRWRFINDVQPLNGVTIRDSGMPPSVDEFSEDFAGYPITSAIDYYSGYNQIPLDKRSRDLTAFMTDVGLVRSTRLPQGWTNSVAHYQRVMIKVHSRQIPHEVRPFLDDCGIKGPKDRYNDAEVSPGVRRFVYEHAQIFERYMHDVWISGMTISGNKSAIGVPGITIVGLVCDYDGRHPEQKKVLEDHQLACTQVYEGCSRIYRNCCLLSYFYCWFCYYCGPYFYIVSERMCDLTGLQSVNWRWTNSNEDLRRPLSLYPSISHLRLWISFLMSTHLLRSDGEESFRNCNLTVLFDLQDLKADYGVTPKRSMMLSNWNVVGLLKALKKFRFWLYGRHFLLETDAQTLVWLLNQPPNDLPNAMMTRWLTYIRLFDFDVKHIPGNKNGAADALSRRGRSSQDDPDDLEDDADDYFDAKLYHAYISDPGSNLTARVYLHEGEYEGEDLILGQYLETLQRSDNMTDQQYQQLRRKSRNFLVRDGYLFKRGKRQNIPPRRVVGRPEQREEILKELHDESGHRGSKATYNQVSRRYQWKGMYDDVVKYVKSCEECQRRARIRYEEPLHPTWSTIVWEKIGIDVVYMPNSAGYRYIVFARDDLSGWVEGRALAKATSKNVAKFIYEEVICRHGCPKRIVMDRGTENLDLTKDLLEKHRIRQTLVSAYHPQANGLVERGHDAIVNALAKYDKSTWKEYLPLALWADRISVRRSTGYSAFELVYGRECLLPVQFSVASWCMIDWEGEVKTREDLLVARIRQLDQRALEEARAAENLERSRKENKDYFDEHKRLRGDVAIACWGSCSSTYRKETAVTGFKGEAR